MYTQPALSPARYPRVDLSAFSFAACQLIAAALAHSLHLHPNTRWLGMDGATLLPAQVGSHLPAVAISLPAGWQTTRTMHALIDVFAEYGSDAVAIAQPMNGHTIQGIRIIYLDLCTGDVQTVTFPLARLLTQPANTVRLTDEDTLLDLGAVQTAAAVRTMRAAQPHGSMATLIADITDLMDSHCPSAVLTPSLHIPVPVPA